MRAHIKSLSYLCLVFALAAAGCRKKEKPNVLALIPEDAPVVSWMPSPDGTLSAARTFLATFDQENLGDQVKLLRNDWKKQYGVDPLDAASLRAIGLDTSKPWAAAWNKTSTDPVYFVATTDGAKLVDYVKKVMKDVYLIDEPTITGSGAQRTHVFAQPFGNTSIEVCALRLTDNAAMIATGAQASKLLQAWPTLEPAVNFQKAWKRAESDGSAAGAALRVVARDSAKVLPRVLADRFAKDAELRGALSIKDHRVELFFALLGAADVRPLFANESGFKPGLGLPEKPVLVARSQMNAGELYTIATTLGLLKPLLERIELTEAQVGDLLALGTGAGAFAVELQPESLKNTKARTPTERIRALLDAFPITAVAELKKPEDFDAALVKLEKELKARGFSATLDKTEKGPAVLKTASLSPTSQVSLSRKGSTLIYGIGPGAFGGVRERLGQEKGLLREHPTFGALFEPHTSGAIVDLSTLVTQASVLPEIIFGDQNSLLKGFFGSTIKSFAHFQQGGVLLGVEGPAHQPHPVIRLWLTTK